MENNKKTIPLVERLKRQALEQKREAIPIEQAQLVVLTCPHCGAGRAKHDGLTRCAYCGHPFTGHQMSDGIHIKSNNNTR